jgi:GT2 family glycosyltransferase/glycosyltransferase involved in cell wall biosynthesis
VRRVLFLAYHFPPIGGSGVQRNAKFVRYLPDLGYEPIVVTGTGEAQGRWTPADDSLLADVPPDAEIHRLAGPEPAVRTGRRGRLERLLMLHGAFNGWWIRKAADAGRRAGMGVDVIYASLAPYETAVAAARLARDLGKPWVADLQDPWALDEIWLYPTAIHRRRDLHRMRRLLATADAIVMNTPEAVRRVRTHFPELAEKIVVSIPNGFDPPDFTGAAPERDDETFRIVHTGYLYTDLGLRLHKTAWARRILGGMFAPVDILTRSHLYLLEAIRLLTETDPSLRSVIDVHLAGAFTRQDWEVSQGVNGVRMLGYLNHRESIALLRSADLLFLPMQDFPPGYRAGTVPGKAYEYLASRRPILAAVPDGDARDLLDAAGTALLCRPADSSAMASIIAQQIQRRRAGEPTPSPDPEVLARFERRRLTEELVEVFDAVAPRHKAPVEDSVAAVVPSPTRTKAPEVSILLVNWNTLPLTLDCLDSLPIGVDDDLRYEVIVVDNGSRDGSAEALAGREDIHLIANRENVGFAAAVNQAYAHAHAELILLLNSDVRLTPGCLSTLVRFLRGRQDIAGVVPLYLNLDGTRQEHYYRLPTFTMSLANANAVLRNIPPFSSRVREYRMLDDNFSHARPVPQPSASCLLLRRSCLPPGRLLDERYAIYFNDVELARWLADRGRTLWMTPEASVYHVHGASTRLLGPALKRQHLGSLVRYLSASEPPHRVHLFRLIALTQGAAAWLLRRPGALPITELRSALRGEVGPLPQLPSVDGNAVPASQERQPTASSTGRT